MPTDLFTFTNTSEGREGEIQEWIVPHHCLARITAYGAEGGPGSGDNIGGKGAKVSGEFELSAGQVVKILVGQKGIQGGTNAAGGGGGTFVVFDGVENEDDLLLAAGGGGGGGNDSGRHGVDGISPEDAVDVYGLEKGEGTPDEVGGKFYEGDHGTPGHGAVDGDRANAGGGGGGFLSSGYKINGAPGDGYLQGGLGANGGSSDEGGFGGGGATNPALSNANCPGGGGGGYSGGQGGGAGTSNRVGGGGGGSYNSGEEQENESGVQEGHGLVEIEAQILDIGVNTDEPLHYDWDYSILQGSLDYLDADISSVSVYFEWGTDQNYGNTTEEQTLYDTGDFSAEISGLTGETTYHYRAVATDGDTIRYGQNVSFTTKVVPVVEMATLRPHHRSGISINGVITSLGLEDSLDVYFEWGTESEWLDTTSPQTMGKVGEFTEAFADLDKNTKYCCRAVATNGEEFWYGEVFYFTPKAVPLLPGSMMIEWDPPEETVDHYEIYRLTDPINLFSLPEPLSIVDFDETSFADMTASPLTRYFYRVASVKNGEVALSDEVSFFPAMGGGGIFSGSTLPPFYKGKVKSHYIAGF